MATAVGAAKSELIIHPVRLRIIQAFGPGRRLTAHELFAAVPDVARASLYRHLNVLLQAGVLRVAEKRPVRGVYERVFALEPGASNVGPPDYPTNIGASEHLRFLTRFLDLVRGDFERYLSRPGPTDLAADGVAYYQLPLYLSAEEFKSLVATLRAVLAPLMAQQPAPGRERRLLSIIAMPAAEGTPAPPDPAAGPTHAAEGRS
jgi:DNA-binding transcriptional ArsR family regulator